MIKFAIWIEMTSFFWIFVRKRSFIVHFVICITFCRLSHSIYYFNNILSFFFRKIYLLSKSLPKKQFTFFKAAIMRRKKTACWSNKNIFFKKNIGISSVAVTAFNWLKINQCSHAQLIRARMRSNHKQQNKLKKKKILRGKISMVGICF